MDERQAFEDWAKTLRASLNIERRADSYASLETALIWEGWQARAQIAEERGRGSAVRAQHQGLIRAQPTFHVKHK